MSYNNRKRKNRPAYTHRSDSIPYRKSSPDASEFQFLSHHEPYQQTHKDPDDLQNELDPLRLLYIQAHEADVVHGPTAEAEAQSLEVIAYHVNGDDTIEVVPKIGSALIQWSNGDPDVGSHSRGTNEDNSIPAAGQGQGACPPVWVDRYDARLLLDISSVPRTDELEPSPASPSGWSDLPSDTEDMFFFTPDEIEDFHREKRRRLLERTREERLKALLQEDGVDEEPKDEDVWGGSDEEPDDTQKELMHRTAAHLLSSPNPAQLEMRILTNHGGDRRFAFLRGRWKRAWNLAKAKVRMEKAKAENEERARIAGKANPKPAGLGIVAGYGSDSDSDEGRSSAGVDGEDEAKKPALPGGQQAILSGSTLSSTQTPVDIPNSEDAAREAKRKRLKEWTERRRAEKDEEQ